jgi:hypothetical protein
MIKGDDRDRKGFALNEQLKKRESCYQNDLLRTINEAGEVPVFQAAE